MLSLYNFSNFFTIIALFLKNYGVLAGTGV
jgi:hypothetical protein